MDNRLKEMNDYILMIEKKSSDLIKKYQKTNQDLNSAIKKIDELTNKLEKSESSIKDAKKNSLSWLRKKTVSEDVLRTLFSPAIKVSKDKETGEPDGKYPPTIKAKIGYKFGTNDLEPPAWLKKTTEKGKEKEKLEGDWTGSIPKGQTVQAIIKCSGVWFSGGKFGVTWKVAQLMLDEPKGLLGCAFRESESDNEEDV